MTDSVAYIVEQYVKRYYTQRDYRAFKMRSLKSLLIHKEYNDPNKLDTDNWSSLNSNK